ncbi:MAG: hypothetical protein Q8K99_11870 [Actinomycetota bacterium]|nr:hypothetical protein [Actinomycetota bacterium]
MAGTPYLVFGPAYRHNCGGVRALHRLVHLLNERGQEAYSSEAGNPDWNEKHVSEYKGDEGPIVVYPEVVFGNPVGGKKVVRWVLNVPGFVGGPTDYPAEDLVFTWSKKFLDLPDSRLLSVGSLEHELFNTEGVSEKTIDCFYVGRGITRGATLLPQTDGLLEITSDYPPTRKEVAALMKKTRTLYSYDDVTQVVSEALLCGCRVVLLPENVELTLDDREEGDTRISYEDQLRNFVEVTQAYYMDNLE